MTVAPATRVRRTQAERTAETREALLGATIRLLHEKGYSGTTTELIADVAGVSRGALRHHFPTRAQLMAEVISYVYEEEVEIYREKMEALGRELTTDEWPDVLWSVISRPSGMAVLEVLNSSRSDAELAALVGPAQSRIETASLVGLHTPFTAAVGDVGALATIRLFVWTMRGLAMAKVLAPDPENIGRSVKLFKRIVKVAVESGVLTDSTTTAKKA